MAERLVAADASPLICRLDDHLVGARYRTSLMQR